MKTYMYVGNPKSRGASKLCEGLGIQRIKHEGSNFVGGPEKRVINWGSIKIPDEVNKCKILNAAYWVGLNSDKYLFFKHMDGYCRILEFTTDIVYAAQWIAQGYSVVERHQLRSSGGAGIRIVQHVEALEEAPLYTRYQKKQDEYRIHLHKIDLMKGIVFDMQQKKRKDAFENPNWMVRNHKNGFIYARKDIKVPADVESQAIRCFNRTGLDFGAVDVIYDTKDGKAYVLEINTAPGLRGTTLENYLELFCND